MPEPIKVNVVSYGGVRPGQLVAANGRDGGREVLFDAATSTDGSNMFYGRTGLTTWDVDLPELTKAPQMFYNCTGLTTWRGDIPKLDSTWGSSHDFFHGCTGLTTFEGSLAGLTSSTLINACPNLEKIKADFASLTTANWSFQNFMLLTTFEASLPLLTSANGMFNNVQKLTTFNAGAEGLKSLESGDEMFARCILSPESAAHVLETIPTYTEGEHKLHLGTYTNYRTSARVATLLGATTPIAAGTYNVKGWTVTVTN